MATKTNETPKLAKKIYTSVFPNHKIGTAIQFSNGIFSTSKQSEQNLIESDPMFGQKIFITDKADPMVPKLEPRSNNVE